MFVVFMMMIEFVIPCDPELIKVTYYSVYENTVIATCTKRILCYLIIDGMFLMQKVTMDIKNDKPKRFRRSGTFLFGERLVIMHAWCLLYYTYIPRN